MLNADVVSDFDEDGAWSALFPDLDKIARCVRHDRCFDGALRVGGTAPDVEPSTLDGEPTLLSPDPTVLCRP